MGRYKEEDERGVAMQLPRVAASPVESRRKQRRRLSIKQELIIESRRAGTVPLKSVHGNTVVAGTSKVSR